MKSQENYVDDELNENTILRFNQSIQNYPKVTVGNTDSNLTKYDRRQITDTTRITFPNYGVFLLHIRNINCNDKNNNGKLQNFRKSTKSSFPSGIMGATSLRPIADSFMYIETSAAISVDGSVFVSFERTDNIQISNISFSCNRFSILTNYSVTSIGRFRIQQLMSGITWSTLYSIPKNDHFSNSSTQRTLVNLNHALLQKTWMFK